MIPGVLHYRTRGFSKLELALIYGFFYLLAIFYCRWIFYRDPTSAFFNPSRGYQPRYSAIRTAQAETYIQSVAKGDAGSVRAAPSNVKPKICLGIATVARDKARYFRTTVGSLLEGLGKEERDSIHLVLFIAQTDNTTHPAFREGWMEKVADTLLWYNLPEEKKKELQKWEAEKAFGRKGLFDYTYLLKACQNLGSDHVAIIEDDNVAMDGWLHRTQAALEKARDKTEREGKSTYLYLRLFYTEEFLGWNSEEWMKYLTGSISFLIIESMLLMALRITFPRLGGPSLTSGAVFVLVFLCTPPLIALFFACGRASMLPLPRGVNSMPRFGCCSQGFVFPQSRVPDMITWYESKDSGYVDMLTEDYGNANNELRWAITPSVLQHVGSSSSKGDDMGDKAKYGRSVAEKIWNFEFETQNAKTLRDEHTKHLSKIGG